MFALIESCPDQRPSFGWTGKLISFTIHVFVVSAAVAFTRQVVANRPYAPTIDTLVWHTPPVSSPPRAPVTWSPPRILGLVFPPTVTPFVAPTVISPDIPPPGTAVVFTDPGTPGTSLPGLHPGSDPGASLLTEPREERFVDDPPVLVWHPPIRYPEVMRQAGIEGRVLVETVLDTLGRAEPAMTRVVRSGTDLFDREAVSVVLASRYRAARVGGRVVRVRIAIPVNFTITR